MKKKLSFLSKALLAILVISSMSIINQASAKEVTTSQNLIYEGDLLDDNGLPLTGDYSFRFSLWENANFESSDIISGALNVASTDFLGWQESQSATLVGGKFSFKLGSVTPFTAGLFDRTNIFLQVEVKKTANSDTSYEFIDIDINSSSIDRSSIETVPFAFNADKLDFRDTGYDPGDIPFIDPITGKLPTSIIDGIASSITTGIDGNTFKIDIDGNAASTDILTLKFGETLAKTLSWNGVNERFEFNDDVNIAGNLVVSGTVNGISLAPKNKIKVLSPRYPNSIMDSDGTDNFGAMYEEVVVISGKSKNALRWESKKTGIQDYDVIIRKTLPANFAGFEESPVSIEFMSEGTFGDAKLDFTIRKEGSEVDELSGTGIGFNSNSWINMDLNLNKETVWAPNDIMIIKIKMYSRNNLKSHVGDISLRYIEN